MNTALRHVGIVVHDLTAMLALWKDGLGFSVVRQMEESGRLIDAIMELQNVQLTTVKLAGPDGAMIELLKFHSHPDAPRWTGTPKTTGLTHVALTVNNIEGLCAKLSNFGVTPTSEIQTSPDGAVKLVYARGPEGLLLELVQEIGK